MTEKTINLFLVGPVILALFLAFLAVSLLVLTAWGRLAALTTLTARTVAHRMQGRILPIVWGVAAEFLLVALAAVLFRTKVLGLLALLVLFLGFALAGLGVCLTASRAGRVLLAAVDQEDSDALCSLILGLVILFLAAFLPVIGWAVVALASAAGVGVVLEEAFRRQERPPTSS